MVKNELTVVWAFIAFTVTLSAQQNEHATVPRFDNYQNWAQKQRHYYDSLQDTRGSGRKPFMREFYYNSRRLDENGQRPEPTKIVREIERYLEAQRSKNYGTATGNWQELGPFLPPGNSTNLPNGAGRINCLTFHPHKPNIIYAGAPSGGFWKTEDRGLSWQRHIDGMVRLGVSSIVVHPENTDVLYIGTGDRDANTLNGYGVWRSTDGGQRWHPWHDGMDLVTVNEILMHPDNPDILIAATNDKIYRSTDGGAHWTVSFDGYDCKDIAFHPTNPNIVYAVGDALYKSTDNGVSFQRITIPGVPSHPTLSRMAVAVSAHQPDWVYVLVGGRNGVGFLGVYRSTDQGENFVKQSDSPNILGMHHLGQDNKSQSWYDLVIYANPDNANIIYVGAINLWRSLNGGVTWELVAHRAGHGGVPAVHADVHAIERNPHTSELYLATDGGVHYTVDQGQSWMDISDGLSIAQLYKLGVSNGRTAKIIVGKQDNGTALFDGKQWMTRISGDGMEGVFDPLDEKYVYGSRPNGRILRSTNGGEDFQTILNSALTGETGDWVTPFQLHPSNTEVLFVGLQNVWMAEQVKAPAVSQIKWHQLSHWPTSEHIWALAVAPSHPNIMYVAHGGTEKLYKTTNALSGNPSWEALTDFLPNYIGIEDIEIDPADPNHLWIALGNKIYESANGGYAWTDISGSLPDININTIVRDNDSPVEALYIGMDVGVHYRDETMSDWVLFADGLPNVEVTELEIYQSKADCRSKLYAATYGNGLWMSDLYDSGNWAPEACFRTSLKTTCVGQTVRLVDQSSYSPEEWQWSISPDTYSFVNGTSATSQHPEIVLHESASYSIALTVSNASGATTTTQTDAVQTFDFRTPETFNLNFDNLTKCSTASDCEKTICNLSAHWKNRSNGQADDVDWRVHQGATPSSDTGPICDFNKSASGGRYIYLEASGGCGGSEAILESTCMALDEAYELQFAYHMYGEDMGSLHVDIDAGEGWQDNVVPPLVGNQGSEWKKHVVDLSSYLGRVIRIRLRGKTGKGYNSDLALDDIRLKPLQQNALSTVITDIHGQYRPGLGNQIVWHTDATVPGGQFELQRYDTLHREWKSLQRLTVEHTERYQSLDPHPVLGSNLYRIILREAEQTMHTSPSVQILTQAQLQFGEVFPNPMSDHFSIPIISDEKIQLPLTVTDVLGREIHRRTLNVQSGEQTIDILTAHWESGFYIVRLGEYQFKIQKMD